MKAMRIAVLRFSLWAACVASLAGQSPRASISEGHHGRITTDKRQYRPLDTVTVHVEGRERGDAQCRIRVADAEQKIYFERELALSGNKGSLTFEVSGRLGNHYIYLWWPGERRYSRYLNFRLEAETGVQTGDRDFDGLYEFSREAMRLGRRDYQTPRGRFVGYISADTNHFDGIWLHDWIYTLPGYRHWETEMLAGLDRFLEVQSPEGMVPDGIERDGRTWRVGLESDVEYILTLGVWQSWQATGDQEWLRRTMPKLEKALAYIQSDPKHWDAKHRLIKRQHSCDTWDYDIDGATDHGASRHVIAACDQSGYYQAFQAMARMYASLGDPGAAAKWRSEAEAYRDRAVKLLWDGTKFQHHVHLDKIDHGDFDETKQLAMGNTWAVTRGFASHAQSARVIEEYRRRHKATGDAYPWWSLQPGYPDHLGYWKDAFRLQGRYANGGLMPWVGGELCRGAFQNGREPYGVELLRQYADHLRRTGGAHVWYFPDGKAGFRTNNEVNYAGWGMAQWVDALMEGLAGVRDETAVMGQVEVSPRWTVTPVNHARVTYRYAASSGYFSYDWTRQGSTIRMRWSGGGDRATMRVLLPVGAKPRSVTVDGKPVDFRAEDVEGSHYTVFGAASMRGSAVVEF